MADPRDMKLPNKVVFFHNDWGEDEMNVGVRIVHESVLAAEAGKYEEKEPTIVVVDMPTNLRQYLVLSVLADEDNESSDPKETQECSGWGLKVLLIKAFNAGARWQKANPDECVVATEYLE